MILSKQVLKSILCTLVLCILCCPAVFAASDTTPHILLYLAVPNGNPFPPFARVTNQDTGDTYTPDATAHCVYIPNPQFKIHDLLCYAEGYEPNLAIINPECPIYHVTLTPALCAVITVEDAAGNPLSGAKVYIGNEEVTTGADGVAKFYALWENTYNLQIDWKPPTFLPGYCKFQGTFHCTGYMNDTPDTKTFKFGVNALQLQLIPLGS